MMPSAADRHQGLFETLLVHAGRPVELAAHLRRLGDSCERLFGAPLPADCEPLAIGAAAGVELGRLRLTVTGDTAELRAEARCSPVEPEIVFPSPEPGAELRSLRLPGGLGAHKWVDRSALAAIREPAVALLLDADGTVLEAGRANVFVVRAGALATAPADGRILPGIARQGLLEVAREGGVEVVEQRLDLADLRAAEEVFLTGSVRGLQRAGSLDGDPLPPAGALSAALAAGLRQRWGLGAGGTAAPSKY